MGLQVLFAKIIWWFCLKLTFGFRSFIVAGLKGCFEVSVLSHATYRVVKYVRFDGTLYRYSRMCLKRLGQVQGVKVIVFSY